MNSHFAPSAKSHITLERIWSASYAGEATLLLFLSVIVEEATRFSKTCLVTGGIALWRNEDEEGLTRSPDRN